MQILCHDFMRIHADLEGNCHLFPTQRNHRRIRAYIVEVIGEGFVKLSRLWFHRTRSSSSAWS